MSTTVYCVYEMYEVEDDLGTWVGAFSTPQAATQAIASFILWRMSFAEIDDWHPRAAPWGSTLTKDIPDWDWDPSYFDWSSAELWLGANSVRALVDWYRIENPENHLIVETREISSEAPSANRQGAEATRANAYCLFSNNWRKRDNVLEQVLDS